MNNKLIALGVSAASAATLAFGAIGPATAADAPPASVTTAVCNALPASVTAIASQVTSALAAITTSNTDLGLKQVALTSSTNDLVAAIVSYIQTVNNGGNVTAAGQVLSAKSSIFSDKLVAENNAMTASFEAQRNSYLSNLVSGYTTGIQSGLCI